MHIYQCFLVLIVALMHLPNTYENLWKTKTQAPWPPLLETKNEKTNVPLKVTLLFQSWLEFQDRDP